MWEYYATVTRVVDGDTIDLDVDMGFHAHMNVRCRLYGIDTPETFGVKKGSEEYEKGMKSKAFVLAWMDDHSQRVAIRSYDSGPPRAGKYGRWLVEVFGRLEDGMDTESLNEILVRKGLAKVYNGGKR